jgi:hypothetical protein
MLRRSCLAFVLMLTATASAFAQAGPPLPFPGYQGTQNDQKACEPAVFKFCRAAVPDTFRVLQCLQANRPHIGKACQAVLATHGQ